MAEGTSSKYEEPASFRISCGYGKDNSSRISVTVVDEGDRNARVTTIDSRVGRESDASTYAFNYGEFITGDSNSSREEFEKAVCRGLGLYETRSAFGDVFENSLRVERNFAISNALREKAGMDLIPEDIAQIFIVKAHREEVSSLYDHAADTMFRVRTRHNEEEACDYCNGTKSLEELGEAELVRLGEINEKVAEETRNEVKKDIEDIRYWSKRRRRYKIRKFISRFREVAGLF